MSSRRPSATAVFVDAVEGLCLRDATLADVTVSATALHEASDLAAAGTAVVSALLYQFRARAGSRSAEWWTATLEGSKATELPSHLILEVLVVLAADAGGVALSEIASLERAEFMTAYLQLAAVIVTLVHLHGGQSARETLQLLRDRSATTGI